MLAGIVKYTSDSSLISPFIHKAALRGLYEMFALDSAVTHEEFKPKLLGQRLRGLLEMEDTLPQDRYVYKRILATKFEGEEEGETGAASPKKKGSSKGDKKKQKLQKLKQIALS